VYPKEYDKKYSFLSLAEKQTGQKVPLRYFVRSVGFVLVIGDTQINRNFVRVARKFVAPNALVLLRVEDFKLPTCYTVALQGSSNETKLSPKSESVVFNYYIQLVTKIIHKQPKPVHLMGLKRTRKFLSSILQELDLSRIKEGILAEGV